MKTNTTSFALAAVLMLCASSVLADETAKSDSASTPRKESVAPKKKDSVPLTGSYIKQKIRKNGVVTDGPSQVVVIDRNLIDQTGASDLRQLLVRRGVR
jgi:hypothetical protein